MSKSWADSHTKEILASIYLYSDKGGSDKIYNIFLEGRRESGALVEYHVYSKFGPRRKGTRQCLVKYTGNDAEKALKEFNKLKRQKTKNTDYWQDTTNNPGLYREFSLPIKAPIPIVSAVPTVIFTDAVRAQSHYF